MSLLSRRIPAASLTAAGALGVLLTFTAFSPNPAAGQNAPAAAKVNAKAKAAKTKAFTPPKTPWGDPDIQGSWPGNFAIPLQRPESFGERTTVTKAELKQRDKQAVRLGNGNWTEYFPPKAQASLVVDPKNGRIPPMLPEAEKRIQALRGGLGPADILSPEKRADWVYDFDPWGRCITRGVVGSMLPNGLYNMGNQIVQSPGYVVIRNEMVHEARIIPISNASHPSSQLRMWMGDRKGHWQGTTLVVETTNMTDKTKIGSVGGVGPHSEALKLTERFTLSGADDLDYDVTIDDPQTWTAPWTLHIPYHRDDKYVPYEYACHEANYGMLDIIKGYRETERKAAEAAAKIK